MAYLGGFEQLILFSVLDLGADAYGVAIRAHIEERTGRVVSSGSIYTSLGRMEAKGLVTSREGRPTEGRAGRPRKLYTVEPAGARALEETHSMIQAIAGGLLPRLRELAEQ